MENEVNKDIRKLQIQIGCIVRLNRLRQGLSQLDLSLKFGSNSTLIGRIERAASISGWDKIYILSKLLGIPFEDLYYIKPKRDLLKIVSEARDLEEKLTTEKAQYYDGLVSEIEGLF